jgi:hypothetical protein
MNVVAGLDVLDNNNLAPVIFVDVVGVQKNNKSRVLFIELERIKFNAFLT